MQSCLEAGMDCRTSWHVGELQNMPSVSGSLQLKFYTVFTEVIMSSNYIYLKLITSQVCTQIHQSIWQHGSYFKVECKWFKWRSQICWDLCAWENECLWLLWFIHSFLKMQTESLPCAKQCARHWGCGGHIVKMELMLQKAARRKKTWTIQSLPLRNTLSSDWAWEKINITYMIS